MKRHVAALVIALASSAAILSAPLAVAAPAIQEARKTAEIGTPPIAAADPAKVPALIQSVIDADSAAARDTAAMALHSLPAAAVPQIKAAAEANANTPAGEALADAYKSINRRQTHTRATDDRFASETAAVLACYVPRPGAAFNDDAIIALRHFIIAGNLDRSPAANRTAMEAAARAAEAGCDDPLVLWLNSVGSTDAKRAGEVLVKHAAGVRKTYPAFIGLRLSIATVQTIARLAGEKPTADDITRMRALVGEIQAAMLAAAADTKTGGATRVAAVLEFVELLEQVTQDEPNYAAVAEMVLVPLKKAAAKDDVVVIAIDGIFAQKISRQARGGDWIQNVPAAQMAVFTAEGARARRLLVDAYEKDKTNPYVAKFAMLNEQACGGPGAVQAWFIRSVQGDQTDVEVFGTYCMSLMKRWSGSEADQTKFSRDLAGGIWGGTILGAFIIQHHGMMAIDLIGAPSPTPAAAARLYAVRPDLAADAIRATALAVAADPASDFRQGQYIRALQAARLTDLVEARVRLLGDRPARMIAGISDAQYQRMTSPQTAPATRP